MKSSTDQGGCYPSKSCKILHILRKPNSIIALLFIQNIFKLLNEKLPSSLFVCSSKITQPCPQVFSVNSSIICSGLLFWHHFDIICSIIYSWLHFYVIGQQQLVMVNYACGFDQSETGKYFDWMIISYLALPWLKWYVFIHSILLYCSIYGITSCLQLVAVIYSFYLCLEFIEELWPHICILYWY